MEFIELMDCIRRLDDIDPPTFACTVPNADGYSFLRLQPQGTVQYERTSGVWLRESEHAEKCRAFLSLAYNRKAMEAVPCPSVEDASHGGRIL